MSSKLKDLVEAYEKAETDLHTATVLMSRETRKKGLPMVAYIKELKDGKASAAKARDRAKALLVFHLLQNHSDEDIEKYTKSHSKHLKIAAKAAAKVSRNPIEEEYNVLIPIGKPLYRRVSAKGINVMAEVIRFLKELEVK